MSGVGVLTVLDRMIESNRRAGIAEVGEFAELIEARAAVSELVDADKEYDAAFDARIGAHWLENESRELFNAAANRRSAALARVQVGEA